MKVRALAELDTEATSFKVALTKRATGVVARDAAKRTENSAQEDAQR